MAARDAAGRVTQVTDASGNNTWASYTTLDQTAQSTDAPTPCPSDAPDPSIHRISGGRVQPSDVARALGEIAITGRGPTR